MSVPAVVEAQYHGLAVHFTEEAWFNATEAADRFGRRVNDFLVLPSTKEYLAALEEVVGANTGKSGNWLKTQRGSKGGTWMHPRLAVAFARWLDPKFGVWCDLQIDALIRGKHPQQDWKRLRHEATASYKVMSQILQLTREAQGKDSAPHHFSNEAKLVNWALAGKFEGLDRNSLAGVDLDLLAKLEELNAVLIGCGASRDDRKARLEQHASDFWALRKQIAAK